MKYKVGDRIVCQIKGQAERAVTITSLKYPDEKYPIEVNGTGLICESEILRPFTPLDEALS